ncbi:head-to-tail connector complex protein [Streptomyces phage Sentinel]|uniref:Head-to-tail connector complex protein n=1 Tax=Streptomyces phage Sentinel TaxID=2767584 RepID=A0A873WHK4_9CAUD|nr:head-to-tail connector complex protein [Streptomyces phage Sentinel]QPB09843.1 head-to-tail connector complex protein [Streptomyces phage Sentinel]
MAGLPPHIKALAELSPVEDLMLAILRDGLPGIEVKSLIAKDQTFPLVLVRRDPSFGNWGGDTRFLDAARVAVHVFCQDPDGDEDAAILSEAVRVVIRDAWLSQKVVPGRGHITRVDLASAPRRVTDWATATGPVQYADLPTGVTRYEATYDIEIRKPRNRPYPTP